MAEHDVIVVGAGIGGTSFAALCAQAGLQVLLVEAEGKPGGCLRSHRSADGFWFELGAHTCYASYQALLGLVEQRPGLDALLPREKAPFRVWSDGALKSIPKVLNVPELLLHVPSLLFRKKEGQTVREYYGGIVGPKNFQRVFGPILSAVPSQPADDFPAQMLFKKRRRRKDVPRSFTVRGGLQNIPDALAATPGVQLEVDSPVEAVEQSADGFKVRSSRGVHQARFVALAVPPTVGAKLLAQVNPEAAAALGRIQCTAIQSFGVVVKKERLSLERVAGIIDLEGQFYSGVSRDVVDDAHRRGFAFHFRPGTHTEQALRVVAQVLGVRPEDFEHVVERQVVLPSPRVGHEDVVAQLDRALASSPLLVTGNYFAGLSIEDVVQRSKQEASRLFEQRVRSR